ncbi:MAG TPA: phosphatase PAP2 family protein [Candidatus Enterousia intestinigallinarum]|uniref:Phosphatase PAP2 family protein n=1 Tax=Candidatus Enterousia intestinigallinarum TaxID=2840790 RepID=A0A9D1JVX7_9PROT|nr:phosphatase PAP2 family protein [Candidatus Enterousia intestinigallinarum]
MLRFLFVGVLGITISLCAAPYAWAGDVIAKIGDFISFKILPVYSFGTTIYNSDWDTWYDYDWNGLKQLIVVNMVKSTVVDGIKENVFEMRPNGSGGDSFPSGHTANAFAQAAFIHRRYGIKQAIVPYVLATFVGFSRVESRMHYTHDVLAGATIGFLSAWIFADEKKSVVVSADTNSFGLRFNFVF